MLNRSGTKRMSPSLTASDGRLRQGLHLHKPLIGDEGLHHVAAAVAVAHRVGVLLHLFEQAQRLQVLHHPPAGLVPVKARVRAGRLGHAGVIADHLDLREAVALADLEVVGVVGGRHLDHARAELRVDELVGDDRESPGP